MRPFLSVIIYWPVLLFYFCSTKSLQKTIHADALRWVEDKGISSSLPAWRQLLKVVTMNREFRNLFRHRLFYSGSGFLHWGERLLRLFYYGERTLYIKTSKIGNGLRIQHGFATIIDAVSIGENCWINQQVTIGYTNKTDCPIIGDNVRIYAGAKVLGKVTLGNDVVVGANAVVVKDVPPHCTVVGVPAQIIKIGQQKVC